MNVSTNWKPMIVIVHDVPAAYDPGALVLVWIFLLLVWGLFTGVGH